ncbi:MAG: recombinase family protein [Rubrobacter sp.]|nr:recombinase family protein [Rubrobacter sp.]
MPTTNGSEAGPKKAVLYARVSTEEQARSGYSLAQQLEALRQYAAAEGYEVLEEVADPGQSGASLERPGMDRVRDVVAGGGVSVVLAQDRDRFAREPAYLYLLKQEFAERGSVFRSLNDRGDESPEGELTDGILDQLAKFERAKTAERTRRGRFRRAREGKVVGNSRADYGFRFNEGRDNYEVNEEEMAVVRRIFRMVAVEGMGVTTTKKALDREGVRLREGGKFWSTIFIKRLVLDDVYKPHSVEEIESLVSPEVAAKLDRTKSYGIWWYGKNRWTETQVLEDGRYRRKRKVVPQPRDKWIAVPVPDSGVPRQWVDSARVVTGTIKEPHKGGERFSELAGGMLRCGSCGAGMQVAFTRKSRNSPRNYYYRCGRRRRDGKEACSNGRGLNVRNVEPAVWSFVSACLKDPEHLREGLKKHIENRREELRAGSVEREAKMWADQLTVAERKRGAYQDQQAEGLITLDELRQKLDGLDETRREARERLEELAGRQEEIESLEQDVEALISSYSAQASEGMDYWDARERHRAYRTLQLTVTTQPDSPLLIDFILLRGPAALEGKDGCTLEFAS